MMEQTMNDALRRHDAGSLLVIFITLALFVMALFVKGLTHDLLLEAGVFLVSVKLIIMSHKSAVASSKLHDELAEIRILLHRLEDSRAGSSGAQSISSEHHEPLGPSN
jgi:hypothetical protein